MSEANKAFVRRTVDEAVNQGKLGVVDELVTTGYVYHGPGGQELRGPEGLRQLITMYRTAFPDLHMSIEGLIAEGDNVVLRWTVRATHKGDLQGIAPTGKKVTVTGIAVSRFEGGKIAEEWESFDQLSMMEQIGAVPATVPASR